VPENQEGDGENSEDISPAQAKHEAAEIVARARRQAEAIVAEARGSAGSAAPSPLAALGDNAEEIIGQVRKLIKKQRQLQDERQQMQAERQEMQAEIEALKAERDELVQRLTDAVVRMEELAAIADQPTRAPRSVATTPPPPPPPAKGQPEPPTRHKPESQEDTSLAARLEQAERERREAAGQSNHADGPIDHPDARPEPESDFPNEVAREPAQYVVGADGRSFYSRHSAKLPRLEGDGGRSVLSAVGDMRPDSDPRGKGKGRKSRRRKKS
jgi:hypothetical protein